jgi:OOP family OmpA-OmpF porin
MIENDLLSRSRQTLAAGQIPAAAVKMDGRDATLVGVAGSDAVSERTRAMVDGIYGVRVVNTEVIAGEPPAVTVVPPSAPAMAPAHQEAQEKLNEVLAAAVVEFNTGSAQLTPRGKAVLDRIAPILASVPDAQCDISGHTDSIGDVADNQLLSSRRAQVTKEYLVAKGIAAARLFPVGFGSSKPIAPNKTEAGRQKNRRIEFQLKGRN